MSAYKSLVGLLALTMVGLGAVLIVSTVLRGGGATAVGIVLGLLFVAAGVGRLYLMRRKS
jgi:hypothetical protein